MTKSTKNTRSSFVLRLKSAWLAARLWLILVLGLVGTIAIISLPLSSRGSTYNLEVGSVASQDILAPYAMTYNSEVLLEEARQSAAAEVNDIYDPPDTNVARQQLDKLQTALAYIDNVRADTIATADQKLSDLAAIENVSLDTDQAEAILYFPDSTWESIKLEATSVLEQVMRSEIREGRVEEARRRVPALVSITLPSTQSQIVSQLASAFVAPNAMYNAEATENAKTAAREAVQSVSKSYADGEMIVNRGDIVTPLDVEGLQTYGLLDAPNTASNVAIRALLVLILGGTWTLYAHRVHGSQIRNVRLATMLSLIFIFVAFVMQLMLPDHTVLPYIFPAATVPMLLTIIFSPGMGIVTSMVIGALAGFLTPRGLEVGLYMMVSASLACLVIGRAERLSAFFWSGLVVAISGAFIVAIFRFPDPATDLLGKLTLLGSAVLCGMLSASLAFGFLLLMGSLLGMTTSLQLIELSRPDHPLLQLVLNKAPGTYQHSLQVANLAEQAARAIGANALLTRVGALYHDAGKALHPQYFIENQIPGQNVHDQLDPETSASVIIQHVADGLELARKYHLPQRVKDFIAEHHGTLGTSFQYNQALNAANGDSNLVNRKAFTYPGPRPRSRETAILMLADSVEAKARADVPTDEKELDKLVRWIIDDRLAQEQLSRTDLTLRDIDTIRRSFVSTLKNFYHPRLRYPESNQENQSPAPSAADQRLSATPEA
jgi:putative nucleotidyltransferase with HDIG domain